MIRTLFATSALILIAAPAIAAPEDKHPDPRVEEILNQMPTRDEIKAITKDMPDMTHMIMGLKDIAEDEDTHATFERLGTRLESTFSRLEAETADGEIPDLNALFEDMMMLSTDRQTMGDLLGLAFQVKDVMEEAMPEETLVE
jgi:hypothetical protein